MSSVRFVPSGILVVGSLGVPICCGPTVINQQISENYKIKVTRKEDYNSVVIVGQYKPESFGPINLSFSYSWGDL